MANKLGKSGIIPSTKAKFLGFVLDSRSMVLSLSLKRQEKLQAAIYLLSKQRWTTVRTAMKVLGLMTSTIEAIPCARWHLRPLQWEILSQWDRNLHLLNRRCLLSPRVQRSLKWWKSCTQGSSMTEPKWILLTTDASLSGWGAHLDGVQAQGTWNTQQRLMSSNPRELQAISLAFFPLCPSTQGESRKDQIG